MVKTHTIIGNYMNTFGRYFGLLLLSAGLYTSFSAANDAFDDAILHSLSERLEQEQSTRQAFIAAFLMCQFEPVSIHDLAQAPAGTYIRALGKEEVGKIQQLVRRKIAWLEQQELPADRCELFLEAISALAATKK
jgi:hypothetical protein